MQIIRGKYPPNYDKIAKTFDIKDKPGIVFTYGDKLFVPSGNRIDVHLLEHEEVHAKQQKQMGIEKWWERYLEDPGFRLQQEVDAYRIQYKSMANLSVRERVGYLDHIANDLSGPMYGSLMTKEEARFIITKDNEPKKAKSTKKSNNRKAKKRERQNRKKGRR